MQAADASLAAPVRTVRVAAVTCLVAAVAVAVSFTIAGHPLQGGALATGLALGSVNGMLAGKLINLPVPFLATSLLRLVTLSLIGVAIGLAFGLANIWLVILGLGLAQFSLAASALRAQVRR